MVALLAIGGAVVMFTVGWIAGRSRPATAPASPVPPARAEDSIHAGVLALHPTGVVVGSTDGSVEYRNPAASAVGGTHVGVLIDAAIAKHLAEARSRGRSTETLELYGPPKRTVVVTAQSMASGRAVAFVEDISDWRRAEQARTDFVANVSHELRTPIGALVALADSLEGAEDAEVVERVVARMQTEAQRASRIVEDLLELSEIESGVERDLHPVALIDVMHDAAGRVAELASRGEIEIETIEPRGSIEPSEPDDSAHRGPVVTGDRHQLASAVGNMVENAVKYSEPGDVVHVAVRDEGGFGEIVVADEGAGIPRTDLDRVFERFYRVDRARSRGTGGTGLGLSIVRHVAQAHGGSISVDSVEGQGATFVLRLPLARNDADGPADPVADDTPERAGPTAPDERARVV